LSDPFIVMDISRSRFPFELVSIIQLIAKSHFVAFDLEFSGIVGRRRDRKKPTLQEVYEDVKGAAEQYQVLQVGFTVVQEDLVAGERPTKSSTRHTMAVFHVGGNFQFLITGV
jgi:hypothetical protein